MPNMRQDASCRGTNDRSPDRRTFTSTWPFARFFSLTINCSGMPRRSASLNFTPGESSRRSSYSVSIPAPVSSA